MFQAIEQNLSPNKESVLQQSLKIILQTELAGI
jgi:hypothetical protein